MVLNIDIDLNSTKKKFSQLQNITILNLHNFFEKYLRKIYISKNNKHQDLHGYNRPSYLMKRIVDLLALVFFSSDTTINIDIHSYVEKNI